MDFYSFDLGGEHEQQTNTAPRRPFAAQSTLASRPKRDSINSSTRSTHSVRAAEAYIRSQKCEGWEIVYDRYDDGGFSGGNIERPALKRLMEDIQAGKIDCVVVYKVDRLSRSLLDFAKVMENVR